MLLIALCVASCSFVSKKLSLTSANFNGGELAELLELVNTSAVLTRGNSNDPNAPQEIRLEAQVRLKKLAPHLKSLSISEISIPSEHLKVTLLNTYGATVTDLQLSPLAEEALKRLLMGNSGDVATILFAAKFGPSANVAEIFNQSATFAGGEATHPFPAQYNLDGTIGRLPVRGTLVEYKNGVIHGAYYYKRYGPKALLYLKGKRSDEGVEINEFNNDGLRSGIFEGRLKKGYFSGIFVASLNRGNNKSSVVKLLPNDKMKSISIEEVDFARFSVVEGTAKANAYKEEMERKRRAEEQ